MGEEYSIFGRKTTSSLHGLGVLLFIDMALEE